MRAQEMKFEHITFINLLKVNVYEELNSHGVLYAQGIIARDQMESYINLSSKESTIKVSILDETKKEEVYFNGYITDTKINSVGQVSVMSLTIKTESNLLDIEKHIRSFQNTEQLYPSVIETCIGAEDGKLIVRDQDKPVQKLLLQYQETDFEFAKRIAGDMETVLIPEFKTPGKKFYIGYKPDASVIDIRAEDYERVMDYSGYQSAKENGEAPVSMNDYKYHIITTREVYELGAPVLFQNKRLVIGKAQAHWNGEELLHTYTLITSRKGLTPKTTNQRLTGLSLTASVVQVKKDKVQVAITGDEHENQTKLYWFTYATVYSTPDGTGWYCMPEIGDMVRVVFPTDQEKDAYVASSVHLESSGGRSNPEEKSWKNKQGKEIILTPDKIALRNNQGLSVELCDESGIEINSDKDITMEAQGDVKISSQGSGVTLSAADQLLLQRGGSKIQLAQDIRISGGKIYMN